MKEERCRTPDRRRRALTVACLAIFAVDLMPTGTVSAEARTLSPAVTQPITDVRTPARNPIMRDAENQEFVNKFAAAWAARDASAFLSLWHPDGKLHYPFASRVILGSEIGKLNDLTKANAPHLTWSLLDWTARGDVVVIEWESSNKYGEHVVTWRGVDKITLQDGKIIEEVVYADTAPLQAMRQGKKFDALIQFPD